MDLFAFCIYDAAAAAFLPPMFVASKGVAIRSFQDAVNEEGSQFALHAADYTLFHIGSFDPQSGELKAITPDSMGNALQYVVKGTVAESLALEA